MQRIPSLDGLRAVSISLVLFGHSTGTLGFPVSGQRFALAEAGVRIFFVISGFLITKLLLEEMDRTGTVSLRGFYRRRVLRIFPAFYTYWLITAALTLTGYLAISHRQLAYAATYVINYVTDRPWSLGHLWSLAVEEQFYALWPLTLFLLGRRRSFYVAGGVFLLVPLVRLGQFHFLPSYRLGICEEFHTIADCIATGCLLAGCRDWLWENESYRRFLSSWKFWLAPLTALAGIVMGLHPRLNWLIGIPLFNVAIAVCIDRWTRFPAADYFAALLNWKPLIVGGVLSYSLYLWQQPFLNRYGHHAWNRFPLNLALAFAAASASYLLIEKPFLKLRYKTSHAAVAAEAAPVAPAMLVGNTWPNPEEALNTPLDRT